MLAEMTIRDHRDYGNWVFGSIVLGIMVLVNIAFSDMINLQTNFHGLIMFAVMVLVFNVFFGFVWFPGPFISRTLTLRGNEAIFERRFAGFCTQKEVFDRTLVIVRSEIEPGFPAPHRRTWIEAGKIKLYVPNDFKRSLH